MSDPTLRLATALSDRYRLDRELGQGGMGPVYQAHDLKQDRDPWFAELERRVKNR